MSSAEPHLKQFELEVCPQQFRLAVLAGDSMMLGFRPSGTEKPNITITRHQGNENKVESMLDSLHWLLVANNVLDTPLTAPNCVYNPMYMKDPSVHLLLAYSDGRKWGSMYVLGELPENMRNLLDQVQYMAMQSLEPTSGEASGQVDPA